MNKDTIQVMPGYILVKPKFEGTDGKTMIGDVEIEIPGGYEGSHRNINVIGTVVNSCTSVPNNRPSFIDWVPEPLFPSQGDMIWYAWNEAESAYKTQPHKLIEVEGWGQCILVNYARCFAYLSKDRISEFMGMPMEHRLQMITLMNGFVLGKGLKRKKQSSILEIVNKKKEDSGFKVEIMHIGHGNHRYMATKDGTLDGEEIYPRDTDCMITVGDIAILDMVSDVPVEGDLNRLLGGENLYRFQRKDIQCLVENGADVEVNEEKYATSFEGVDYTGAVDADEHRREQEDRARVGKRKFYP